MNKKNAVVKREAKAGMTEEAPMAWAVSEQWAKAQQGLMEIIKFGAMMMEVSATLAGKGGGEESGRVTRNPTTFRGNQYADGGDSIKGWLEEHCPEVNYNTAKGYMAAAKGLRRLVKMRDDVPLLVLMGDDAKLNDTEKALHEKVMETLGNSSQRLLMEAGRNPLKQVGRMKGPMDTATRVNEITEEMGGRGLEIFVTVQKLLAESRNGGLYRAVGVKTARMYVRQLRELLEEMARSIEMHALGE